MLFEESPEFEIEMPEMEEEHIPEVTITRDAG